MIIPQVVFERRLVSGDFVRIWRQQDGRFAFEHLMPTGKGRMISCSTMDEAWLLWEEVGNRESALSRVPKR